MSTELRYQRGSFGAREIQVELDAILVEMTDDPAAPDVITVAEGSQGADPVTTTILITVISHAAAKVFDEIILPKLKDRLADDAVGPPVSDDDGQA
jgi:hypothetical protein